MMLALFLCGCLSFAYSLVRFSMGTHETRFAARYENYDAGLIGCGVAMAFMLAAFVVGAS